jgi:hypothetical protein
MVRGRRWERLRFVGLLLLLAIDDADLLVVVVDVAENDHCHR